MTCKEGAAIIEAILFTMGDSVEINALAKAMEVGVREVRDHIDYLKAKYENEDSGIGLIEIGNAVQLCTKKEMYEYLVKIAKTPKKAVLTDSLMETLSIIAYKQPITRLEVEKIRGVNSDHAVNRLVEFGLVQELGRLDAPGRPLLFGTTEEFLRSFGVKSLDELPTVGTVQVEEFKAQAEQEVNVKLDI
ncbi:MAG: SMC-Scp complex subunit ScpB [Butyrivibrio sp.]|nr:SMC-Scp complex subunit ScpB [Butyrivibrio sp.]